MMFRCKECGSEYDVKPDYCDCGNDTFDEIVVQKTVQPKAANVQSVSKQAQVNSQIHTKQTSSSQPKRKKTFSEQYPEIERLKERFDPISTGLFVLCLIAAFVVLFFVGNPEEETDTSNQDKVKEETQTVNIPAIDTFWNNSTAGIINNEKSKPKVSSQSVPSQSQNVLQDLTKQPPQPPAQNQISKTVAPVQQQNKAQQTAQSKPQTPKIFGNNSSNNISSSKPAQNSKVQPQAQKPAATQNTSVPKIPKATQTIANQPQTNKSQPSVTTQTAPIKASQTNQTKKTNTTQQASKPATKNTTPKNIPTASTMRPKANIDTAALKKELDNYKIGLRNTIGRKVDFTRVIGDGECIVAFKVGANGKLTNRSFAKQSSNITLNDAVYSAVMATPSYNPPPSGYKNETLNLKIRFYNGNYDVSLY